MDELEQLKKVLRALVVSSPCQVDMYSLLRDYRQMMGGHLPSAKHGYREPLPFLKERFNDCFVFHGDPKNPILTPIVTEELKHIDKFVQSQKKSAAVKFKGKRRSIEPPRRPAPEQQQPDLIVKTFKKFTITEDNKAINNTSPTPESTVEQFNHNHQQHSSRNNTSLRPESPGEEHNHNQHKRRSPEVTIRKSPEVTIRRSPEVTIWRSPEITKVTETQNSHKPKDDSSSNAVRSFLKRKTSLYNSQYLDGESSVNGKSLSRDDDSGRQTSSSNSIKKSLAMEQLKDEVVELVASSAEGVWCTDLLRLYREHHGRELNFGRFGFTSIISLVSVLDARLSISRPDDTGDWLLRHRLAPPAAPPAPRQAQPRHKRPPRTHRPSCNVDPDDALPGIDFDPDVFPVDCMHFMESIPGVGLGAVEAGALLEVMVGEVYSPSHFWLIRLGDQFHLAMEQIMDEMTEYYTMGEGKDRYLAMGAVRVGHYCSSLFDRDWHRSLIVKVIDSETVKVRHVDYGTVDSVAVRGLKPLLRCWGALPAQAVRARLAGVRPGAAGRRWPHAACTRFLDKVRDTKFVASVVAVDREEDILEVFLVNTSTDVDDDVSADLVRSGHADPRRDSSVRSGECFLFPRFAALESGATPNYAEICVYLRDGISLDYVDDYRRHVPDCLPPAAPLAAPPAATPTASSAASEDEGLAPDHELEPEPEPESEPEPSTPPRAAALVNRVPLFPTSIPLLPNEPEEAELAEAVRPNRSEPALPSPRSPPPEPPHTPAPSAPATPATPAPETTPAPPSPAAAGGITLSASECETFQYLSRVDPAAAHWFMVGALGRAAPPPAPLNAAAPEFRPSAAPPFQPNVSAAEFRPRAAEFPSRPFPPPPPQRLLPPPLGPYPAHYGPPRPMFAPPPQYMPGPCGPFVPGSFMPPPGFGPR